MEEQVTKSERQVVQEFIREFAELNLELTKQAKNQGSAVSPELLRELRENAQALMNLV